MNDLHKGKDVSPKEQGIKQILQRHCQSSGQSIISLQNPIYFLHLFAKTTVLRFILIQICPRPTFPDYLFLDSFLQQFHKPRRSRHSQKWKDVLSLPPRAHFWEPSAVIFTVKEVWIQNCW